MLTRFFLVLNLLTGNFLWAAAAYDAPPDFDSLVADRNIETLLFHLERWNADQLIEIGKNYAVFEAKLIERQENVLKLEMRKNNCYKTQTNLIAYFLAHYVVSYGIAYASSSQGPAFDGEAYSVAFFDGLRDASKHADWAAARAALIFTIYDDDEDSGISWCDAFEAACDATGSSYPWRDDSISKEIALRVENITKKLGALSLKERTVWAYRLFSLVALKWTLGDTARVCRQRAFAAAQPKVPQRSPRESRERLAKGIWEPKEMEANPFAQCAKRLFGKTLVRDSRRS
jgi:hypothetical protein